MPRNTTSTGNNARSRSPVKRGDITWRPALRTWVLVRPIASKCWHDAKPALISQVNGSTLHLLMPNMQVLDHSLADFKELRNVAVCDIRKYEGSDQPKLTQALMDAFRKYADGQKSQPSEVSSDPKQDTCMEPVPVTPTARTLKRSDTPEKLAGFAPDVPALTCSSKLAPCIDREEEQPLAKLPIVQEHARERALREVQLAVKNLAKRQQQELIELISAAFTKQGGDGLTYAQVVRAASHRYSEQELACGLKTLERQTKTFRSGDLVFLIA